MQPGVLENDHSTVLSQSIVKTVLYYDLFSYPLRKEEVYSYLQTDHVSKEDVADALAKLLNAGVLFQFGDFFSVHNNPELKNRRLLGNERAATFRSRAVKRGHFIYQFPFVQAVMISGSLSKDYADENTDIDFFIVTSTGRLWIARTLLVMYKRLFLLNNHKYFCVNYFIDEDHLEIEEKNLFTATELSTLIPLQGKEVYTRFFEYNHWLTKILPHARKKNTDDIRNDRTSRLKSFMQWILRGSLGTWLDTKFMRLTLSRWKKIYGSNLSTQDFEIAFKSKKYVSKNHSSNYQQKIMERYQARLREFGLPLKWTHD